MQYLRYTYHRIRVQLIPEQEYCLYLLKLALSILTLKNVNKGTPVDHVIQVLQHNNRLFKSNKTSTNLEAQNDTQVPWWCVIDRVQQVVQALLGGRVIVVRWCPAFFFGFLQALLCWSRNGSEHQCMCVLQRHNANDETVIH